MNICISFAPLIGISDFFSGYKLCYADMAISQGHNETVEKKVAREKISENHYRNLIMSARVAVIGTENMVASLKERQNGRGGRVLE